MTYFKRKRIDSLSQRLQPSERFRALVEHWHRGEDPPDYLVKETPEEQVAKMIELTDLYHVINAGLAGHVQITAERLKTLGLMIVLAETYRLLAAFVVLAELPMRPRQRGSATSKRRRRMRHGAPVQEGDVNDPPNHAVPPEALDQMIQEMVREQSPSADLQEVLSEGIENWSASIHKQLRAIEQTVTEANENHLPDGDLANPSMREDLTRQLAEVKRLRSQAASLRGDTPTEPDDPGEDELALIEHIAHTYSLRPSRTARRTCDYCRQAEEGDLSEGEVRGSEPQMAP